MPTEPQMPRPLACLHPQNQASADSKAAFLASFGDTWSPPCNLGDLVRRVHGRSVRRLKTTRFQALVAELLAAGLEVQLPTGEPVDEGCTSPGVQAAVRLRKASNVARQSPTLATPTVPLDTAGSTPDAPARQPPVQVPGTQLVLDRYQGVITRALAERVPESRSGGYFFSEAVIKDLQLALNGLVTLLIGPPGSGKSSLIAELAALTGTPLFVLQGSSDVRRSTMFGQMELVGGSTRMKPGPVIEALRADCWLLVEEVTAIPPGAMVALNNVLSGEVNLDFDGQTAKRGPNFRVFLTSNVAGAMGDASRRHPGQVKLDFATMSRVGYCIKITSRQEELHELIKRWTPANGSEALKKHAAQHANEIVAFYLKLFASATKPVPDLSYIVTPRDLRALWEGLHAPIRRVDGETPRNVRDVARSVLQNKMANEAEALLVENLIGTDLRDE